MWGAILQPQLPPPPVAVEGSLDTGDPTTTNLFVGNLSPQVSEAALRTAFGAFGALASVKVMWPRTAEDQTRGHLTGFVAFMRRADAEEALAALNNRPLLGTDIRCGGTHGKGREFVLLGLF